MNTSNLLKAAGIGFTLGVVHTGLQHLLNREKVVIVPAETDVQEFKPFLPPKEPLYVDAELQALLDEEAEIQARENTTLHIPMVEEPEEVEAPAHWSAFTSPDSDWDDELEKSQRDPNGPYIITAEEYIEDQFNFHQETVTFYAGDDIMADMRDVPIYNWSQMMGPLLWGHGSGDKTVVYIRNEKLRKEWEVLLHQGSFETEVAGYQFEENELKHSLRKFRDD